MVSNAKTKFPGIRSYGLQLDRTPLTHTSHDRNPNLASSTRSYYCMHFTLWNRTQAGLHPIVIYIEFLFHMGSPTLELVYVRALSGFIYWLTVCNSSVLYCVGDPPGAVLTLRAFPQAHHGNGSTSICNWVEFLPLVSNLRICMDGWVVRVILQHDTAEAGHIYFRQL
jgi:hypothetical protein